jgi:hypothetical protein
MPTRVRRDRPIRAAERVGFEPTNLSVSGFQARGAACVERTAIHVGVRGDTASHPHFDVCFDVRGLGVLTMFSSRLRKTVQKTDGLDRLAAARNRVIAGARDHEVMHSGGHLPKCGLCTAVREYRAALSDTKRP